MSHPGVSSMCTIPEVSSQSSRRIFRDVPQEVGGCLRAVIRHLSTWLPTAVPSAAMSPRHPCLQKVAETTPSEVKEFVMWKSSESDTCQICEHLKIGFKLKMQHRSYQIMLNMDRLIMEYYGYIMPSKSY